MSMCLGKIHYWLYEKIKWFSKLEKELLDLATKEGLDSQAIENDLNGKYGKALDLLKPLEDVIDTNNIHGWLQDKINNEQGRTAMITAKILEGVPDAEKKIKEIYKSEGVKAADEVLEAEERKIISAKEIYDCMNDYILDGMPCDRVNEVINATSDEVTWKRTMSVHKDSFHAENVDVECFYNMRDEWIKSFVGQLNSSFEYEKLDNNTMKIYKK